MNRRMIGGWKREDERETVGERARASRIEGRRWERKK